MRIRIFAYLPVCLLCLGCINRNARPQNSEQLDSIARAQEKSFRVARKIQIQDSLKIVDGDTILGGFYFGMTEQEFKLQEKKLINDRDGSTKIGRELFSFRYAYPWIYKGKLRRYTIYTERYWSSKDYEGGIESIKDMENVFTSLTETFTKKYGEPDKLEARDVLWSFDFKTIEIIRQSIGNTSQQIRIEYTQTEYLDTLNAIVRKQNEEYEIAKEKQKLEQERKEIKHSTHF